MELGQERNERRTGTAEIVLGTVVPTSSVLGDHKVDKFEPITDLLFSLA